MGGELIEASLLGHYWQAALPDGGTLLLYFYESPCPCSEGATAQRRVIWTEIHDGEVSYRTEPCALALKPTEDKDRHILLFDGIHQGFVTWLGTTFLLDQLNVTYFFHLISDPQVRAWAPSLLSKA